MNQGRGAQPAETHFRVVVVGRLDFSVTGICRATRGGHSTTAGGRAAEPREHRQVSRSPPCCHVAICSGGVEYMLGSRHGSQAQGHAHCSTVCQRQERQKMRHMQTGRLCCPPMHMTCVHVCVSAAGVHVNALMCVSIKQIVQRSADTAAIRLMRQAVSRHQNSSVPTNFGHGRTMVGSWTGYGKVDLVKTYLAMAQKRCSISLVGTQGGCFGFLSLRGLRAPNGPWRVRCPDMQHFQAALCLHMRDDHAQQLGIRSFSDSRARLTVREIQKITDQLVHMRKRPASDRLTKIVVHARTGMLIKAPWEQFD